MSRNRCADCKFYFRSWSECRRYPPFSEQRTTTTHNRFPETDKDWWCGEFQPLTRAEVLTLRKEERN